MTTCTLQRCKLNDENYRCPVDADEPKTSMFAEFESLFAFCNGHVHDVYIHNHINDSLFANKNKGYSYVE